VVPLAVKQMDFVTYLGCIEHPLIRGVFGLAFPVQFLSIQVVVVLRERLLFLLGNEEDYRVEAGVTTPREIAWNPL